MPTTIRTNFLNNLNDIQKWKGMIQKRANITAVDDPDHVLLSVIDQFQTFAQEFLGFFENRSTGILHKSKGFNAQDTTPDRLRFQALIALETYWTLIRRVAEQRQIDHYREILDEGTRKAEEYLTQLGLDLPGVCLYFNKYTAIQYSPYSNVAFIGLPYFLVSAIDPDDRDWMAIPHELGHYVYWNLGYCLDKDGQNVWTLGSLADARQWQADLRNGVKIILEDNRENLNLKSAVEFNILQNNVLNWVEEIFADVVGTRLAGAEFIKSYEKLIVSRTGKKDDLKINDGTHPPDCVRPYLRTHALTKPDPKAPDWDTFFRDKFNIKEISRLQLRFFSPIAEDNLSELASRDERGDIVLTVSTLRQALELVVDYLKEQLDTALTSNPTDVGELPDSTFKQLEALAKSEAKNTNEDVYKKLLQPRILEGGYWHTHNLYAAHIIGVHSRTTHNH